MATGDVSQRNRDVPRASAQPSGASRRANSERAVARLPPLVMVRAFEAVGRMGSMRRAAEDIGVTHNVVSHHIRNLEAWLKTSLVERSPRGVSLTSEGRQFHRVVTESLAAIAEAASRIRPATRRGVLRVWCMPGLASRWLPRRLSDLERHLEDVEIILRPMDTLPDFARQEADLMIGFGHAEEMPAGARLLAYPRVFPVVSPVWLAENGRPERIEELSRCPLIHEESREQWSNWFTAIGIAKPDELTGPRLWNANLCIDAALAGRGVALGFAPLVDDLVRAGQLVELFDTQITLGGYFLVAPSERWADTNVARFREWIEGELK